MRGWIWAGVGFGVLAALLAVLALLDTPHGLEAQPTGRLTAAGVASESYTLGVENTSFWVQNTGIFPASLTVDYYDPAGDPVAQEKVEGLAAGSSMPFRQDDQADLPSGFEGSAVVTADQAVGTIIFKYIQRGDDLSVGGDDGILVGHSRVYLPLIYSRFGPNNVWNTRFALQNVSITTTACVQMTYRWANGTIAFMEPTAGTVADPACPSGGLSVPPQGALLRNQADMTEELPAQFEGSVIIELAGADHEYTANSALLAATADIFSTDQASFASYKGLGWTDAENGDLSTTVLVPLILKNFGEPEGWNTHYYVSTLDPAQTTNVTVTYCCDSRLSGPDGSLQRTFSLKASAAIHQALEDELPNGFDGSAVIEADQPVAVVVTMDWAFPEKATYAAFTGIPDSVAADTAWVPVMYKNAGFKGPLGDADGWNSWLRIQVADGGTANVRITYHGEALLGGSISFNDTVDSSWTFYQSADPLLPEGFEGSAVVTSDKPVVVIAGVTSDAYQGDTDAIFAGFGPNLFPGEPPPNPQPGTSLVPGWNGICYVGPSQAIDVALAEVLEGVQAVYSLRPGQGFLRWFPGRPEVSTISTLNSYESLFILMDSSHSLFQEPSGVPPTIAQLVQGWNSVCYSGPTKNMEDAAAGIPGEYRVIYALAPNQTWQRFIPNRPEISNLASLEQFDSVLIMVTEGTGTQWIFSP